jgi:hypothetical protein
MPSIVYLIFSRFVQPQNGEREKLDICIIPLLTMDDEMISTIKMFQKEYVSNVAKIPLLLNEKILNFFFNFKKKKKRMQKRTLSSQ